MKDKKFWTGVLTGALVSAAVGAGALLGYFHSFGGSVLLDLGHVQKLRLLERLIYEQYMGEIREDQLEEGIYTGLLYGLGDPYSRYYTPEEYEQESSSTNGSYTGIGISMQKNPGGGVVILECYEGSPGELAGLRQGDIISAVDGEDIREYEAQDVAALVRAAADSVTLTVHREGVEEPLEIQVSIQDVELPYVFPEMLNERTGYIRISEFTGVTEKQYVEAWEELSEKGMEKLVIDLRGNPGGLLNSVCGVLDEILPEGLIVYTEDKNGEREEYFSQGEHPLEIPLVVLVNEESASASEIFAGAVQDYGIGTIVGTVTYGKGVVQSMSRLADGSAVKLTTSKYYTPNGNSIHQVGIQPDVEVELDPGLLAQEEIPREKDNQLSEALRVLGEEP